jgi:hypothetical protein
MTDADTKNDVFLKIWLMGKNLKNCVSEVSAAARLFLMSGGQAEGKRQNCREPCPLKGNEHQLGKLVSRP